MDNNSISSDNKAAISSWMWSNRFDHILFDSIDTTSMVNAARKVIKSDRETLEIIATEVYYQFEDRKEDYAD